MEEEQFYDTIVLLDNGEDLWLKDMETHFIGECPLCHAEGNSLTLCPDRFDCYECDTHGNTKDLIKFIEYGLSDDIECQA